MAVETPICDFGWPAPGFRLPGIDGREYSLDEVRGPKGTLILFICNHCPYVQAVARAYDAVCTPDFFGFDAGLGLQYRGRLDASKREAGPADARRELYEAMMLVADTGKGPAEQIPSMGCSIKWKSQD